MAAPSSTENSDADRADTVTVAEEKLVVAKRGVSEGTVRVRVETEQFQDFARAELERGIVEATRVKVEKLVDRVPQIRTEGDITIIPVVEEVLVVEKRLMLKEELHLRHRTETQTVEQPVTLRRQRVTVDRLDAAGESITEAEPKP